MKILSKKFIRKITISSALFFSLFLLCLMPNKKEELKIKQELEYVNDSLKKEEIYLLDKNNYLAKTNVVVENDDIELKAKELLTILIKNSKEENKIPSGFRGIIPSNTEILSLEYKDGLIKVNFSKELLDVDIKYEEKIIEAIIYTLTSIKGVDRVIIYIDGNIITRLPKSKKILPSTLDRNYGINKEYDIVSYEDITKVTLYYLNSYNDNYYYVPVTKYLNTDKDKLEIIVDELSTSNNNLISFLNSDTKLLDKKIEEKKLILSFNENIFIDKDEQIISDQVLNEITLSVKDNYDIDEVVFTYNDKEIIRKNN